MNLIISGDIEGTQTVISILSHKSKNVLATMLETSDLVMFVADIQINEEKSRREDRSKIGKNSNKKSKALS